MPQIEKKGFFEIPGDENFFFEKPKRTYSTKRIKATLLTIGNFATSND